MALAQHATHHQPILRPPGTAVATKDLLLLDIALGRQVAQTEEASSRKTSLPIRHRCLHVILVDGHAALLEVVLVGPTSSLSTQRVLQITKREGKAEEAARVRVAGGERAVAVDQIVGERGRHVIQVVCRIPDQSADALLVTGSRHCIRRSSRSVPLKWRTTDSSTNRAFL